MKNAYIKSTKDKAKTPKNGLKSRFFAIFYENQSIPQMFVCRIDAKI